VDPNAGPVSGNEMISSQLSRMILLAIEDTAFIAAVALVAVAAVIILFIVVFRRTTTMSNDLSKEYKAKLEALKQAPISEGMLSPAGIPQNTTSLMTPQPATEKINEQIQRHAQENTQLRAKEATYQHEIENLRNQVEALTKELAAERQKLESYRSSLEKEKAVLREQIEEGEKKSGELQEDIEKLERALTAERQEFLSFRTLVQNERVRLQQQMREMEKQRRGLEEAKDSLEKQLQQVRTEREAQQPFMEPVGKKTCPRCGRELQFEDRYCDRCGFQFMT